MSDESAQQPELWPCPRCQTRIPSTSTFCPNCGFALTQQVQGQQTTAVAAPPKPGMSGKKKAAVVIAVIVVILVVLSAGRSRTPVAPNAPAPAEQAAPPAEQASTWEPFRSHVSSSASEATDLLGSIAERAGANDVPGLRSAVDRGMSWSTAELAWLNANPPEPCYQRVHDAWRRTVQKYNESFATTTYALTPPVTISDIERGTEQMQEATALLGEATDELGRTSC